MHIAQEEVLNITLKHKHLFFHTSSFCFFPINQDSKKMDQLNTSKPCWQWRIVEDQCHLQREVKKMPASRLTDLCESMRTDSWKCLHMETHARRTSSSMSTSSRNLFATISRASSGQAWQTAQHTARCAQCVYYTLTRNILLISKQVKKKGIWLSKKTNRNNTQA